MRSGNTVEMAYRAVRREAPAGEHLGEVDVARAERFKTTLRRLSGEEFELLRRHGFR